MSDTIFPVSSFAQLRGRLARLPEASEPSAAAARRHQDALTKPPGSLGRLEDLAVFMAGRSEEHTSELQSHLNLVCRLLLEKKKKDEMATESIYVIELDQNTYQNTNETIIHHINVD